MKVTAQWAEWNGTEFAKDSEILILEARQTPKTLKVTLPSGFVETVKRFDRVGREMNSWRVWYGTSTRKYIEIKPA